MFSLAAQASARRGVNRPQLSLMVVSMGTLVDPGGAFSIDSATGEITVADASQVDFEATPVFNLIVTVTDAGGLDDSAVVTVSLTDANESPTASNAAFGLAEDSTDGAVVGTVAATRRLLRRGARSLCRSTRRHVGGGMS